MSLDQFFGLPAAWFTVPAMVGTLIFLTKIALIAIGGHGQEGGSAQASSGDAGDGATGGSHDGGEIGHDGPISDATDLSGGTHVLPDSLSAGHGGVTGAGKVGTAVDGKGIEYVRTVPSRANRVFRFVSTQTIAAYLMGFGWGGYGSLVGSERALAVHVVLGLGAGFVCAGALVGMLKILDRLKADGTVGREATLGLEGDVYVAVPTRGNGTGQVRVIVDGRERFLQAVSERAVIPTGTRVLVVGTNPDHSVTVMAIG